MPIAALPLALLLPTLSGWLLLRLLEGRTPVLLRVERWALGFLLGLTLTMYLVFLAHIAGIISLNFTGFLVVQLLIFLILAGISVFSFQFSVFSTPQITLPTCHFSRATLILILFLSVWTLVKIAGSSLLLFGPPYLDDTVDNWNLRGKVFFHTQTLSLVMPGEDPEISPKGISSYPPAVPLVKTMLAGFAGEWNEPLINSIHLLWYVALLLLVFSSLARILNTLWALLGTYILASLPLLLIHGVSAYADAFLAAHLFAAVSLIFSALSEATGEKRAAFVRLGAVAAALLVFTKNEALLLYLPPLLLLIVAGFRRLRKRGALETRELLNTFAWYGIALAAVLLPWLVFKWSHELTFGNAKAVGDLGLAWHSGVLYAIGVNTFLEGNWLLLFPLFLALLLRQWRTAFSFPYAVLTCFILIAALGQIGIYLFTPLATEALRQTGYARGLVHLSPMVIFLGVLLLRSLPGMREAAPEKEDHGSHAI